MVSVYFKNLLLVRIDWSGLHTKLFNILWIIYQFHFLQKIVILYYVSLGLLSHVRSKDTPTNFKIFLKNYWTHYDKSIIGPYRELSNICSQFADRLMNRYKDENSKVDLSIFSTFFILIDKIFSNFNDISSEIYLIR